MSEGAVLGHSSSRQSSSMGTVGEEGGFRGHQQPKWFTPQRYVVFGVKRIGGFWDVLRLISPEIWCGGDLTWFWFWMLSQGACAVLLHQFVELFGSGDDCKQRGERSARRSWLQERWDVLPWLWDPVRIAIWARSVVYYYIVVMSFFVQMFWRIGLLILVLWMTGANLGWLISKMGFCRLHLWLGF